MSNEKYKTMRTQLKKIENTRIKVIGEVSRFGYKPGFKNYEGSDTICLTNIMDSEGNVLTDHLWLVIGKQLKTIEPQIGDKLSFCARSSQYVKGYVNYREGIDERHIDYRLSNPTKFSKINY